MSKLSQAVRKYKDKLRLGPIVTDFVKLAERLLGNGTGELKKKLVTELVITLLKRLQAANLPIPDNYEVVIDELIEQAVDLLKKEFDKDKETGEATVNSPFTLAQVAENAAAKKRGGRPKGSRNKTRAESASVAEVRTPVPAAEFDLTDLDLDDEDE
jgi:hypothetical protein